MNIFQQRKEVNRLLQGSILKILQKTGERIPTQEVHVLDSSFE